MPARLPIAEFGRAPAWSSFEAGDPLSAFAWEHAENGHVVHLCVVDPGAAGARVPRLDRRPHLDLDGAKD